MPMSHIDLLNAVIDDGMTEIPIAYPRPDQADKREGALAGFEACRGLDDTALVALLEKAQVATRTAMTSQDARYWWHRMYEAQIEWTLNVISAARHAHGMPTLIAPTARGMTKAVDILGLAG